MRDDQREAIIRELQKSYNMELETVINYLSNSIHLDGIHAKEIKDSLAAEVTDELTHANRLARRLKVLEGRVPGSQDFRMEQGTLQPPEDALDYISVIQGVIDAEEGAVEQYQKLIEMTDGVDMVTQELCIELKGDEEEHRRLFKGYMAEAHRMEGVRH